MPTKYLKENEALIGIGALLLNNISKDNTISSLWDRVKNIESVGTFERFILSLDLLFLLGMINVSGNKIIRLHHDS